MRAPLQKVAAVHDLSGFGRTSLTVVIPILSALGVQVCPLPTAVLSTETGGFDDFEFVDLTASMRPFMAHWKRLGLRFEAVYSGFLGSADQAAVVADLIATMLKPDGLSVVDPVLGDNGSLEATMTHEIVDAMRWLVGKARCITPNLTEAALLLGEPYPGNDISRREICGWLERLAAMGPEYVILTSAPVADPTKSAVFAFEAGQNRFWQVVCEYIPAFYPGTGDTFASVLTGALLQGDSLPVAMDRAVQFVTLGIRTTFGHRLPSRHGILLERVLETLYMPMTTSTYTILEP